uniref:Uncharacterized protein n=1 Tax=Gopherus agassizii TaxID=38772 RepID=A0A452GMS7_9SAUR
MCYLHMAEGRARKCLGISLESPGVFRKVHKQRFKFKVTCSICIERRVSLSLAALFSAAFFPPKSPVSSTLKTC